MSEPEPEKLEQTLLEKQSICSSVHNPHELLIIVCHRCFTQGNGTREELQAAGWRIFVETQFFEDGYGFEVCPAHAMNDYSWEDLY